ncbi:hypothetical protein AHAS_Ahas01G0035100 [Arachis hypogaea]
MCKVVEMLEGPLQSVPCSPKPVMSSPTRIFLYYRANYCFFLLLVELIQVEELIKTYGTATPTRFNYAKTKSIWYRIQSKFNDGRQVAVKILKKDFEKNNIHTRSLIGAHYIISQLLVLDYLHRRCNTKILHLDIKPQNISIDENFCPKKLEILN